MPCDNNLLVAFAGTLVGFTAECRSPLRQFLWSDSPEYAVAKLAGVHRAIVYRWIKLGKIPYVVIFKSEYSKRETIRFKRSVVTEQIQNIKSREPAMNKRQYDIPRYVMDYITAMSKKHRDTPTEISKFIEKYAQQLSANHLQRSSDANNC